ncbi:cobalamin-binding protein [Chitinophaga parva]|uniref:Cobalamin-binding protein n=1 Tax=Chitinophaga parva TaxID=2169414 RepID=A0A2T7BEH5_9BACT|nr:helical backbone metal receptor [Chitinophaga parva]PUZ23499.1 cobalamin-binding protein [Chitinophaga parva]
MKIFTDQLQRTVRLGFPPRRIVSLVPSQTELLHALGLEAEVVGITKFCIHPAAWFRSKTRVGGTRQLNIETIRQLQPDLVIANKEENEQVQIEALEKEFLVWVSDIQTLPDAGDMMLRVGALTGRAEKAQEIVNEIMQRFAQLAVAVAGTKRRRVAYFIWRNPWMVAASNTFIDCILDQYGFTNVFAKESRYPVFTTEQLRKVDCDLVLLSSEPYPFGEKHMAEMHDIFPGAIIKLVDGEMFSWYGSHLLQTPGYWGQVAG